MATLANDMGWGEGVTMTKDGPVPKPFMAELRRVRTELQDTTQTLGQAEAVIAELEHVIVQFYQDMLLKMLLGDSDLTDAFDVLEKKRATAMQEYLQ